MVSFIMLLAALILVLLNGFFVLSEFAIVKVRRTRLEELSNQGNRTAIAALKIVTNLDSYLSAIQLGITLASLALGWIGEPAVAKLLEPVFHHFIGDTNPVLVHTVSFVVAFSFITLLHVVIGELLPKSVAIQKTEKAVYIITWPLIIFHKLTYPVVFIFDRVAAICLRIIGLTPGKDHEQAHSEEEIRMIVNASHSDGILTDEEGEILDNVFLFADKTVREIMKPRTDMLCLYLEDTYEENLEEIIKSSHTRFPLCKTDKDNIIGMIHLRDILENAMKESPEKDLEKLSREVLFVPETSSVATVMKQMRLKHLHLAIVIDEYGGTAGLVSLEDIIEEIIGEISDEYDKDEPEITELLPGIYDINGLTPQGDVEEILGIDLGDQDDETIAGFVFSLLGRRAEIGDTVKNSGYIFEVTAVSNLRITKLKVYKENTESHNEA